MEISFWFGKGDIPNENFRLPPLKRFTSESEVVAALKMQGGGGGQK